MGEGKLKDAVANSQVASSKLRVRNESPIRSKSPSETIASRRRCKKGEGETHTAHKRNTAQTLIMGGKSKPFTIAAAPGTSM